MHMAGRKRSSVRYEPYVYGDTLRMSEWRAEDEETEKHRKQKNVKIRKGHIIFVIVSIVVMVPIGIWYIYTGAQNNAREQKIESLQAEVAFLQEQNASEWNHLTNSITLEQIRKRAEALGMIYVDPSKIVTYQEQGENSIKQYENIPKDGVVSD